MATEIHVVSENADQELVEEQIIREVDEEVKHCFNKHEDRESRVLETTDNIVSEETYLGEFTSTAYCIEKYFHACNDGNPSSTADGTSPIPYQTVAVDPTVIPLGTNLKIETQNGEIYYVKANDTGGSIKGRKIDMVVDTHHNGNLWGVRHVKVWKINE